MKKLNIKNIIDSLDTHKRDIFFGALFIIVLIGGGFLLSIPVNSIISRRDIYMWEIINADRVVYVYSDTGSCSSQELKESFFVKCKNLKNKTTYVGNVNSVTYYHCDWGICKMVEDE